MPSHERDPEERGSPDASAGARAPEAAPGPAEGGGSDLSRVGGYLLRRELGRGGMAVVYEAWDPRHARQVALKVLQPGLLGNPRAIARFEREARALSKLAHPGICAVYDAGVEGEGAYIAMEFVEGEPLGRRRARSECPIRRLSDSSEDAWLERLASDALEEASGSAGPGAGGRVAIETALEVCEKAARALHAAHEMGVVHRDVKPGNILVRKDGEPCILDFGLAWDAEADAPHLTESGDLVGTPAYAAPEQLRGEKRRVDRRSDVYSLGATLFDYLTGRPPFEAPTRAMLYQEILNSEPPDPRRLNPEISRDLKVVLLTALEKDPRRRYQTALDFAEDLRRVRLGLSIRARSPGPWRRTSKWAHRHPVLATTAAAVFLGLAVALGASLVLLRQRQADLLREQGVRLAAQATSLAQTDPGLSLQLGLEAAGRVSGAISNNALLAALENLVEHRVLAGHSDEVAGARFSPDGRLAATASKDRTACVWDAATGRLLAKLEGHEAKVSSALFSPDGRWVITASSDRTARVWETATGRQANILSGHERAVEFARFGRDERVAVTASRDETVRVWDLPEGRERAVLRGHEGPVTYVALSPGGEEFASASANGVVIVWDAASLRQLLSLRHDGEVRDVSFSPEGLRIATASEDMTVRIAEIATGETIAIRGFEDTVRTAAFDREGRRLLVASGDNTARVFDAATGRELLRVAHYDAVRAASWSPDGQTFVTASKDKTARIWNAETGTELVLLAGHAEEVRSAVFSPDGRWVLTASFDRTARIWRTSPGKIPALVGHADAVRTISWSPDGRSLVTGSRDRTARVWDAETAEERLVFDAHRDTLGGALFSPDGTRILTWSKDGEGRVWDPETGRTLFQIEGLDWEVPCASWSPDGRRVVAVERGWVRIRDAASGAAMLQLPEDGRKPRFALFSPDAQSVLVVPASDAGPWFVEPRSGGTLGTLEGCPAPVLAAAFGPRGREVATAHAAPDGAVRIWEVPSGRLIRVLSGHEDDVLSVAYAPDGVRLASASRDGTARIWEVSSGRCLRTLRHASTVYAAAFSPGGEHLVTASNDMTARVWDAISGLEHETLRHRDSVYCAAFSPEGKRIATASRDDTAKVWPLHPIEAAEMFRTRAPSPAPAGPGQTQD